MRVLLVNPPQGNMVTNNIPSVVDEERGHNPPLGLLYVAAYAREHTSHDIRVLDAVVEELDYPEIKERIRAERPDIVGVTATTFTLPDAVETVGAVKSVSPDITVVMGGPHPYIYPDETINLPGIDFLVIGEGEAPFAGLLNAYPDKDALRRVPGLVFRDGDDIINTGLPPLVEDLDSLPFPARDLTPYMKYNSLIARSQPVTTMITSRGCPYKCLFCDRPHLGKKFRARSARNVVDEMEQCVGLGIKEFLIYDDTFTISKKRVFEVCSEIKSRGLDIGWDVRARVDTVNAEMLRAMKDAGCDRIHYGVESGSPEVIETLRKGITLDQVKRVFRETKDAGIAILAYFMIGSPGETRQQMEESLRLAKELDPDYLHLSITTPFPETDLYRLGFERGVLKEDYWRDFARAPRKGFIPSVWEEHLTRDDLIEMLHKGYKDFYLRPGYVWKRFRKLRSFSDFRTKAKAGLKVFKI
ncbi:MAG: radical SAM protein [Nitrospirae bacterium]|nr:radical SAM protein [Nitrospirota bacterium]MBI5694224.1 radical SAM protein [Nitrospirota bacterium]